MLGTGMCSKPLRVGDFSNVSDLPRGIISSDHYIYPDASAVRAMLPSVRDRCRQGREGWSAKDWRIQPWAWVTRGYGRFRIIVVS